MKLTTWEIIRILAKPAAKGFAYAVIVSLLVAIVIAALFNILLSLPVK